MSHDGVGPRAVARPAAFLTAGVLAASALAGCGGPDRPEGHAVGQDIASARRDAVADGGTVRWAVDRLPETLNTFQADADGATSRIAGAVLPSLYRLDANGRPRPNPDYLESAKVVEREPRQVVLYKLNQQAVWSDGREIGAADFLAQWRALSGKDAAYWTARNAGYDRIDKIERGGSDLEVRVTFEKRYADWQSLFSPLYPKNVMGTPGTFNDGARRRLKVTAGPFTVAAIDRRSGDVTLARNPRWWGRPAKLSELVLRAVPREKRVAALARGRLDLAEIDASEARRVTAATRDGRRRGDAPLTHGPGAGLTPGRALRSWAVAHGSDEEAADEEAGVRRKRARAVAKYARQQSLLRGFEVRASLEPAFTQLAMNGSEGPLADERVRRAVARALDREELARIVLGPLGLPAEPVGSHLALAGQHAYADNSGALGGQDTGAAQALLSDAGWVAGGPVEREKKPKRAAGPETSRDADRKDGRDGDGTYIVGETDERPGDDESSTVLAPGKPERREKPGKPGKPAWRESAGARERPEKGAGPGGAGKRHLAEDGKQQFGPGGAPGAYAPMGTAAPGRAAAAPLLVKDGRPLSLRFVLPSGPGSQSLRAVGKRIARMLDRVGIRAEISTVGDAGYFKDHIASGQFDLALYSWPASAFPATDARPVHAKPVPAADGSLNVEQNFTRVGTDQVDQLFDQAVTELDAAESRSLIRRADARIWATAGSIPLYQRPQLTAARTDLANAGAFGFRTPFYEDMGYLKKTQTRR